MKKINQLFSKKFKMPRLFRDDLIAMEEIIKDELKPREYKLETKEYEYENVELIPKDTKDTTALTIRTYLPNITIYLSGSNAEIRTYDKPDLATLGVITKISNMIEKRERLVLFWFIRIFDHVITSLFLFVIINGLILYGSIRSKTELSIIAIIVIFLYSLITGYNYHIRFYRFSVVSFVPRNEKQNFIQKHRDQIILSTMFTTFGAILGGIVTYIFSYLQNK